VLHTRIIIQSVRLIILSFFQNIISLQSELRRRKADVVGYGRSGGIRCYYKSLLPRYAYTDGQDG
jgi:hypothetical protein